jgi:hypothetical protein
MIYTKPINEEWTLSHNKNTWTYILWHHLIVWERTISSTRCGGSSQWQHIVMKPLFPNLIYHSIINVISVLFQYQLIDDQHKKLFEAVFDCAKTNNAGCLTALIDVTVNHFNDEQVRLLTFMLQQFIMS